VQSTIAEAACFLLQNRAQLPRRAAAGLVGPMRDIRACPVTAEQVVWVDGSRAQEMDRFGDRRLQSEHISGMHHRCTACSNMTTNRTTCSSSLLLQLQRNNLHFASGSWLVLLFLDIRFSTWLAAPCLAPKACLRWRYGFLRMGEHPIPRCFLCEQQLRMYASMYHMPERLVIDTNTFHSVDAGAWD
jgi:hypothetical protein